MIKAQEAIRETLSEKISTKWTRRIVTGAEPTIQTGGVKLFLARFTCESWQGVVRTMNDRKTNHAVIDSFEFLINVSFP